MVSFSCVINFTLVPRHLDAVLPRVGEVLAKRVGHLYGPIRGLAHLERKFVGILATDHPSSVYFLLLRWKRRQLPGDYARGRNALIQSLIISGLSIAFRVAQVAFEMRKEKLGLGAYLKSLIEMGAGLPLRAITTNPVGTELDIGIKLIPAQVQSLASALKHNTSMKVVNLEHFQWKKESTEMGLENKNLTDEDMLIVAAC